jgi:hypothetical protein|tara:strand:+ start:964 stop:1158 length:195 start_codon:yes stop_codon:yes gene_type:complete
MKKWILVQTFKKMISSRKFLYTCIGVLTTLLSEKLGLNPEEVKNILISIATLVLGQGIADVAKK